MTAEFRDYYRDLLVGAESWAIDQIEEQIKELERDHHTLLHLQQLVGQLLDILEAKEESDSGNEFHPTVIRSCRVQDSAKLNEIMPQITRLIRDSDATS